MKRNNLIKVTFILLNLIFASYALAHSGGTNSKGCHTKRSTGEYHCH